MDKNQKFIQRLSPKEFSLIRNTVNQILKGDTDTLTIKKLSGYSNLYRVRVGNIRIIFMNVPDDIEILFVGNRNEKTYKKF